MAQDRRHGTVFIAYDHQDGVYSAYWDAEPPGPPAMLEQGPESRTADDAVRWGRERARRTLVRLPDGVHCWAGADPPPQDVPLVWTSELSAAQGNPISVSRECGWTATVDSKMEAEDAYLAHRAAQHPQGTEFAVVCECGWSGAFKSEDEARRACESHPHQEGTRVSAADKWSDIAVLHPPHDECT